MASQFDSPPAVITVPVNQPIETKVIASTGASAALSAALLVALYLLGKWSFVQDMPDEIKGALSVIILTGLTTLGTFIAGYKAKHTPRATQAVSGVEGHTP